MLSKYTKIRIAISTTICLILLVVFLLLRGNLVRKVASFDECVDAGFAVTDALPSRCLDAEGTVHTEYVGNIVEMMDVIRITKPKRNTVVISPVIVEGEVLDAWFLNGTFTATLVDARGAILGTSKVESQPGVRTGGFTRFSTKLDWNTSISKEVHGTLFLQKNVRSVGSRRELQVPILLRPRK